ncbi:MAG: DegT/DnrJ/EryC1/StrS family aminotransferase [Ignavibacteriales bacterium]|nr:DegT/DnrJ/EryC1/StrS family aminotransferase [Ignavibacteriales bacterium]
MIEYESLAKVNQVFFDEFETSFSATLRKGWYILGEEVKNFESEFASFIGVKHCVGLASGLDALFLALKACNFSPGDEVLVPSNTYIATILSILNAGLKPVLVEPYIRSYNIDPSRIEEKITPRTKAIMIVHLYGKPCDMVPVMEIKEKYGLKLIEDCAQSHGATYHAQNTGTFGEFGAFSFYPTKNLGALGDAGAIVTNDDDLALAIRRLRNYGSDIKYYNEVAGFNSRLDEVQAGFLRIKLRKLKEINAHKRRLAALYFDNLNDNFVKPVIQENIYDVFHIFNIRHEQRDKLKKYLFDNGIKTEIHYPVAPHKQKAMQGVLTDSNFPLAEEIHATTLSLPLSFGHTEQEILSVIDVLNKFKA